MKKLLDETSDELTRSLLLAARAHRPPARSRARLLVALGAAGGIGLFSSKAFAWLGTSAGKLTLLGVGVAVAGGAYALADAPVAEPPRVAVLSNTGLPNAGPPAAVAVGATEPVRSPAVAPALGSAPAAPVAPAGVAASAEAVPSSVPAPAADSPVRPRVASPGLGGATARRRVAPAPSAAASRTSRASSGPAARGDDALERMEPQQDGSLSAVLEPPAGGTVQQPPLAVSGLEAEIQLVDAIRGAAQRHDAEALRRLMDDYRGSFPEGQLKREVSELALRALPAGH